MCASLNTSVLQMASKGYQMYSISLFMRFMMISKSNCCSLPFSFYKSVLRVHDELVGGFAAFCLFLLLFFYGYYMAQKIVEEKII